MTEQQAKPLRTIASPQVFARMGFSTPPFVERLPDNSVVAWTHHASLFATGGAGVFLWDVAEPSSFDARDAVAEVGRPILAVDVKPETVLQPVDTWHLPGDGQPLAAWLEEVLPSLSLAKDVILAKAIGSGDAKPWAQFAEAVGWTLPPPSPPPPLASPDEAPEHKEGRDVG